MDQKIESYIDRFRLLKAGDSVLLGVSGGADSLALLYFLYQHQSQYAIRIGVAHLHHGLRGLDADQDAVFIKQFCQVRKIPFYFKYQDVQKNAQIEKKSFEEAGRKARYDFFKKIMQEKKYNKLAVAHHRDDQTETILMRLIRGTGMQGIQGMHPFDKKRQIIRPFLGVYKKDILAYCQKNHLAYRTDLTNFETDTTRNVLRLEVIPQIEKINSGAKEHIANFAELSTAYQDFFMEYVQQQITTVLESKGDRVYVKRDAFLKEKELVQQEMIRRAILHSAGSLVNIEKRHVLMVQDFIKKNKQNRSLDLPLGLKIKTQYGEIYFSREKEKFKLSEVPLDKKGTYHLYEGYLEIEISLLDKKELKNTKKTKNHSEIFFDYGKIKNSLVTRSRQSGDYIYLSGMKGRKKLKNFFIDQKIPKDQRDQIPILADGNEIIWILGYAINKNYQVSDTTQQIIKIRMTTNEE